jgi:nicotinate-nucleotide adenylyltransferase
MYKSKEERKLNDKNYTTDTEKDIKKSRRPIQRIGIMGGTFNPIHFGHLVTAQEALGQFNLDKVIFIPTGDPPHKVGKDIASSEDRYLMTVIATAPDKNFLVSRIETDRKGKSYTIDTVRELRKIYGTDVTLYFITGADAILEILAWKNTEEIVSLCKFIAATRPGYNLSRMKDLEKKLFNSKNNKGEKIFVMEVPALAISSTDIRNRVKNNRPISYLLPGGVRSYILKHGLYG